ncbi:FAD-dependent oxidoreductase [Candidatus Methylocalor cossyra]|uniref:FAD-dependent oxidoreductase n=1 Tax=Candidatus Methylocalor cossyra TaxID=3108543 RepID=UPI0032B3057B
MKRRTFLGGIALGGLAAVTGCANRRAKPRPSLANARVVVLGGGYAGATAARQLKRIDPTLKVTLIERNRYYLSCPGSNEVIASLRRSKDLRHDYKALIQRHAIDFIAAEATAVDVPGRTVRFADGSKVPYDRLILAPGIDFRWDAIQGYDEAASLLAPHAWKAGPQTALLRRRLRGMPNGGVVVIVVPDNPYRCPTAPYERASLMAYFLSRYKPRSKVLVLDAKAEFVEQGLFQQGWRELYPGMVEWLSCRREGSLRRVDAAQRVVHTEFGRHRADLLNVIPPQQAGRLAQLAGLSDASGWCPVDPRSFESTLAPGVHVIGDACAAEPMPKSAFAANAQAKVCAAAVVALLADREVGIPALSDQCYSFLSPDEAISSSGVYTYSANEKRLVATSSGETPRNGDRRREARLARDWELLFTRDVFG